MRRVALAGIASVFGGCSAHGDAAHPGATGGSQPSVAGSETGNSGSAAPDSSHDDAIVAFASCMAGGPGLSNCGTLNESCCTSLQVTGGTYFRTYASSADGGASITEGGTEAGGDGDAGDEGGPPPGDPATVSTFRLDKYLVTVGRFRQFASAWNGGMGWLPTAGSGKHAHLNAGQGLVNSGSGGGYESGWVTSDDVSIAPTDDNLGCDATFATWTSSAGSHENLPINCVNWWESYAFCIWDGGFLPSEAEWEYAAAGGSQQREYPWGTASPGTSGEYAIYGCYPSDSGTCTGLTNIAPVGTTTGGVAFWGQLDLAGDVWEQILDWHASPYVDPCTDCANLVETTARGLRGGYFGSMISDLFPSNRNSGTPADRFSGTGLRCARSP